jgi:hypothetical protein
MSPYCSYILVSFSDYRGLKKQITAIRRAGQQLRPLEGLPSEGQEELGSHSQHGLDHPVEGDFPRRPSDVACVSSLSRRDPDAYPPTKRTLFQTPLPSIDAASYSPTSGSKPETSNRLTRKSSGPGRMPFHARSMSTLRRRRNSQTGKHCFIYSLRRFLHSSESWHFAIIQAFCRTSFA